MNKELPITNAGETVAVASWSAAVVCRFSNRGAGAKRQKTAAVQNRAAFRSAVIHPNGSSVNAFTLVEVLVAMALLSLIVLALMAVFSGTQRAFRATVTQADVQEGSRATMDLIASDFRAMTPSGGVSNYVALGPRNYAYGGVNFIVTNNFPVQPFTGQKFYEPLVQPLTASTAARTNLLQWFFILGRRNTQWTGAGYIVNSGSTSPLYPLYRYYAETNVSVNPVTLYWNFLNTVYAEPANAPWTNMSHLVDGVVDLTVRPDDVNGYWMTNTYQYYANQWHTNGNVWFSPPEWGEVGCIMFSNTLPSAVEIEMGVLEDRSLQHAESIPVATAQRRYLEDRAAQVHVFRQRVSIPNVDPSAYQ